MRLPPGQGRGNDWCGSDRTTGNNDVFIQTWYSARDIPSVLGMHIHLFIPFVPAPISFLPWLYFMNNHRMNDEIQLWNVMSIPETLYYANQLRNWRCLPPFSSKLVLINLNNIPRKHFQGELQNGHQEDDFSCSLNVKITMQQVHDVKHWSLLIMKI